MRYLRHAVTVVGLVLVLVLGGGAVAFGRAGLGRYVYPANMPIMRVNGHVIRVETAKTPLQLTRGLSGRSPLPDDVGMLFYFEKTDIHAFWMPNMRFALDIIWIRDGVVREVVRLEAPVPGKGIPRHTPVETADRVLELRAGLAARYGLVPGTAVALPD